MEEELLKKAREIYFKLRYEKRITEYSKFDDEDNMREKYSKNGGLDKYYFDQIKKELSKPIEYEFYENVKKSFNDYNKIVKTYYNSKREEIFKKYDEIVSWYNKQEGKCGYCGVTQEQLNEIVKKRNGNLTLNRLSKRKNGILEIEQRNPVPANENSYAELDDLILACPLCNNAKSNLIDDESWREIFAEPMKRYYDKLLNKNYGNCVKCNVVN